MKVWSKVHIKDKNKQVEIIAKALTNYLYTYGPLTDICQKYNIDNNDKIKLNQYTINRIAGLLMLYLSMEYLSMDFRITKISLTVFGFNSLLNSIINLLKS